jgi:ribonuclease BN (tRNA processing enzyme)
MTSLKVPLAALLAAASLLSVATPATGQTRGGSKRTKVVFLGTGNPAPNPAAMGTSVAVVVNGTPYIVDAGVGLVRRAAQANAAGVKGLEMPKLARVFLTHLHSDHTIGLPDLWSTPWIMGRTVPLEVWGPQGTSAMMGHITAAWSADNDIRVNGLEKGNATGNKIVTHEIAPGMIYRDSNVTVTAFAVKHGSWKQAFGYRFDTPDRSIVFSGDASPSDAVVDACRGCDMLVHELYTEMGYRQSPEAWRRYSKSFHTTTTELAALATRAKPKVLVLYHQMYFGRPKDNEQTMLAELRPLYKGRVISARDLDVW